VRTRSIRLQGSYLTPGSATGHYYRQYRVVGVFDTVGALGLPAEFTKSPKISTLFDFPDKILPEHIERAYHAMALDEERADFVRLRRSG
jgi:hypothetical protein